MDIYYALSKYHELCFPENDTFLVPLGDIPAADRKFFGTEEYDCGGYKVERIDGFLRVTSQHSVRVAITRDGPDVLDKKRLALITESGVIPCSNLEDAEILTQFRTDSTFLVNGEVKILPVEEVRFDTSSYGWFYFCHGNGACSRSLQALVGEGENSSVSMCVVNGGKISRWLILVSGCPTTGATVRDRFYISKNTFISRYVSGELPRISAKILEQNLTALDIFDKMRVPASQEAAFDTAVRFFSALTQELQAVIDKYRDSIITDTKNDLIALSKEKSEKVQGVVSKATAKKASETRALKDLRTALSKKPTKSNDKLIAMYFNSRMHIIATGLHTYMYTENKLPLPVNDFGGPALQFPIETENRTINKIMVKYIQKAMLKESIETELFFSQESDFS